MDHDNQWHQNRGDVRQLTISKIKVVDSAELALRGSNISDLPDFVLHALCVRNGLTARQSWDQLLYDLNLWVWVCHSWVFEYN